MSHPGDWASSLVDILPRRSQCTLCVCFSHSCVQSCSQQHLLAIHLWHVYRIWNLFFFFFCCHCNITFIRAASVIYKFICINVHGRIQSCTHSQINSCILLIKSVRLFYYIIHLMVSTLFLFKGSSTVLQINFLCWIRNSCNALISHISLHLSLYLLLSCITLQLMTAMLSYINLWPGGKE